MFGSQKIGGKIWGKENREKKLRERKSERKQKVCSKSINYFYMFFQTHLTYFCPLYKN